MSLHDTASFPPRKTWLRIPSCLAWKNYWSVQDGIYYDRKWNDSRAHCLNQIQVSHVWDITEQPLMFVLSSRWLTFQCRHHRLEFRRSSLSSGCACSNPKGVPHLFSEASNFQRQLLVFVGVCDEVLFFPTGFIVVSFPVYRVLCDNSVWSTWRQPANEHGWCAGWGYFYVGRFIGNCDKVYVQIIKQLSMRRTKLASYHLLQLSNKLGLRRRPLRLA